MWGYLRYLLLVLAALHALSFGSVAISKFGSLDGLLIEEATPVAGDFINLYSAAQLTLQGRVDEVMDPERFMAFERSIIPEEIGLRMWAYPPHSLLFAWPFGMFGFFTSLALFSAVGLAVLAYGARRIGLPWVEAAVVLLSPGALHALYYGQTGNLATGLLLLALSARRDGDRVSALSAALLTIKPQMGFLLPFLWLVQRRWKLLALTSVLTLLLVGLTLLLWGPGIWEDYRGKSLAVLDVLEREGTGPFLHMIPSVFIAGRILGLAADPALLIHAAFGAVVAIVLAWRLVAVKDTEFRSAMVMTAVPLISPYLHSYDLALLAVAGLMLARRMIGALDARGLLIALVVLLNWGLPDMLLTLNRAGVPLAPLVILPLFLLAAFGKPRADALSPSSALNTIAATTGGPDGTVQGHTRG